MMEYDASVFSSIRLKRVKTKKGRLRIDVATDSFEAAFFTFSKAAEDFAMTLSDVLHRKFAYRYLTYLQEIARDSETVKPSTISGRPGCRLICYELERLFRRHFFKPDEVSA